MRLTPFLPSPAPSPARRPTSQTEPQQPRKRQLHAKAMRLPATGRPACPRQTTSSSMAARAATTRSTPPQHQLALGGYLPVPPPPPWEAGSPFRQVNQRGRSAAYTRLWHIIGTLACQLSRLGQQPFQQKIQICRTCMRGERPDSNRRPPGPQPGRNGSLRSDWALTSGSRSPRCPHSRSVWSPIWSPAQPSLGFAPSASLSRVHTFMFTTTPMISRIFSASKCFASPSWKRWKARSASVSEARVSASV